MPSIALKISIDNGTVSKTVKFHSKCEIYKVIKIIEEKVNTADENYGLFLTSADDPKSGVWLEGEKTLEYYMLREGDTLHYLNKYRNLRLRLLDGSVKTLKVDDSQPVFMLMLHICTRLGITNHDEYSLCREDKTPKKPEDQKAGNTGTLTLKKKSQVPTGTLERDAKMELLRKKLKTDDDVQWVDLTKTLRGQSVDPGETLLLKRRLFFSDRNVDSRDPVQLGLLYVQARDDILGSAHPVTRERACEFAGIQCQIQFGDYNDEKHTPDLLSPSLKDFLPQNYIKVRGIEKRILKEHMKHIGVNELDAKVLYTKTARSLTTYGVTFFLVKEKEKGKNKLVPRLLGINAESVLRLDESTKEILQIWPLHHVRRWAPTTTTFTLDFGEYSEHPYTVQTSEALRIIDVLTGYIDMIVKRRQDKDYCSRAGDEGGQLLQDMVQLSSTNIIQNIGNNPSKVQTECFTGPSSISHDNENIAAQELDKTKVENKVTNKKTRQPADSGIGFVNQRVHNELVEQLRIKQISVPTILNAITSASEVIVNRADVAENKKLVAEDLQEEITIMNNSIPDLVKGIEEKTKNMDDKAKTILMELLKEACKAITSLNSAVATDQPYDPTQIQTQASKVREATTKLYFSLDPATNRRSKLLLASRKSFIEEDRQTDKRMSQVLWSGVDDSCRAIVRCELYLDKEDKGQVLDIHEVQALRFSVAEKLSRTNAAGAALLASFADVNGPDYFAAVAAVNVVSELMPDIVRDTKAIIKSLPEKDGQELLSSIRELCEACKRMCSSSKTEDVEKINDTALAFAQVSGKVYYEISTEVDPDLENEILNLAKAVGGKTSALLLRTNRLVEAADDKTVATAIYDAGVSCADAARLLLTGAQLTSPCISEPHCQSAMSAAAEAVSSSVESLALSWKPLLKGNQHQELGSELMSDALAVAKALDDLRAICRGTARNFNKYTEVRVVQTGGNRIATKTNSSKLYSLTDRLIQNTSLVTLKGELIEELITEINARARNEKTPTKRRKLDQISQKLTEAGQALVLAQKAVRDNQKDPSSEQELLNSGHKLYNILKELKLHMDDNEGEMEKGDGDENILKKENLKGTLANNNMNNVIMLPPDDVQEKIMSEPVEGQHETSYNKIEDIIAIMSSSCDDVMRVTKDLSYNEKIKQDLEEKCSELNRFLHTLGSSMNLNDNIDDLSQVDLYVQKLEQCIQDINKIVSKAQNDQTRSDLRRVAMQLSGYCERLRNTTKKLVAIDDSKILDRTLDNIMGFEKYIDKIILQADRKRPSDSILEAENELVVSSARVSRGTRTQNACAAILNAIGRYLLELRARCSTDNATRQGLIEHARRILYSMRLLLTNLKRNVEEHGALESEQIVSNVKDFVKELENTPLSGKRSNESFQAITNICQSVLFPDGNLITIEGTERELQEKLTTNGNKLITIAAPMTASSLKVESLARSSLAVRDACALITNIGSRLSDLYYTTYQKRILAISIEDVLFATHKLITFAKINNQNHSDANFRRKKLEAYRALGNSVNFMIRVAVPSNVLQRQCGEATRNMHMLQAVLQNNKQPVSALGYIQCVDGLKQQHAVFDTMKNVASMTRDSFSTSLSDITTAVTTSTELSAQVVYLLSISDQHLIAARDGFVDANFLLNKARTVQTSCFFTLHTDDNHELQKRAAETSVVTRVLCESAAFVRAEREGGEWARVAGDIVDAEAALAQVISQQDGGLVNKADILKSSAQLSSVVSELIFLCEDPTLTPAAGDLTPETKDKCDLVLRYTREMNNKFFAFLKDMKDDKINNREKFQWNNFKTTRDAFLTSFDILLDNIRKSGEKLGLLGGDHDNEEVSKSYLHIQFASANKWLTKPTNQKAKSHVEVAVRNIMEVAGKVVDQLNGTERDEIQQTTKDTQEAMDVFSKKMDTETSRNLLDKISELKKALERAVVNSVVEVFMDDMSHIQDIKHIIDYEKDEAKRKLSLDENIAALLEYIGRVTETARVVAVTGNIGIELRQRLLSQAMQVELLAPKLVQAAKSRIENLEDTTNNDKFECTVAEYIEVRSQVRDSCDIALDPLEFVRSAGEMLHKLCEGSKHRDPLRAAHTATVVTTLANRVILVGRSEGSRTNDVELAKALKDAQEKLKAAVSAPDSQNKTVDWKITTTEILRGAGEVESALGGEAIFKNKPEANQPIFMAAHQLHTAVREWSARDNEIVAAAKRAAVLMAKLSDYMMRGKKDKLIATSKEIVDASNEVTRLARKLAGECNDGRIKNNLLQVSEQIPTMGGQLKILTSVKANKLNAANNSIMEDQEDMNMLVGNAQNIMQSVQEVVKAAAAASVKIQSERGLLRMRWVPAVKY